MFEANAVEKSKHTCYVLELCFLKIVLFVRKKIVQPDRPQMTIRLMCISCCVSKATNRHSEYVILIAFLLLQWLHEHVSMLHCTYITCLVYFTFHYHTTIFNNFLFRSDLRS
jgi:hypothetical protein